MSNMAPVIAFSWIFLKQYNSPVTAATVNLLYPCLYYPNYRLTINRSLWQKTWRRPSSLWRPIPACLHGKLYSIPQEKNPYKRTHTHTHTLGEHSGFSGRSGTRSLEPLTERDRAIKRVCACDFSLFFHPIRQVRTIKVDCCRNGHRWSSE